MTASSRGWGTHELTLAASGVMKCGDGYPRAYSPIASCQPIRLIFALARLLCVTGCMLLHSPPMFLLKGKINVSRADIL